MELEWYEQCEAYKKGKAIIINQKNQATKNMLKMFIFSGAREHYGMYFAHKSSRTYDDHDQAYSRYAINGDTTQTVRDKKYMIIEPDKFMKDYLEYCRETKFIYPNE
jgi:hypothetical protein